MQDLEFLYATDYEENHLSGCSAMQSDRNFLTLQKMYCSMFGVDRFKYTDVLEECCKIL